MIQEIADKKPNDGSLMMSNRSLISTFACALTLVTASGAALAQGPTSLPSSGSLAITALGIGIAVFVAHRIRKRK